jgi:hypothetical protein
MWEVSIVEAQVIVQEFHQKKWLYYIRKGVFFIFNWIEVFEIGLYINIRFKNIAFDILFKNVWCIVVTYLQCVD